MITKITLKQLAKEFNDAIIKQEGYDPVGEDWIVSEFKMAGACCSDLTDGDHTFNELYEHRHALFCALTKIYDNYITPFNSRVKCWKSRLHSDGTMFEDSFIVGMTVHKVDCTQKFITYHLPLSWWDKFKLMELEHAPEWDGHTSNDVIERLMNL